MILTEKFHHRLTELAGIINEAGRIDFLTARFKEWSDALYNQGMSKTGEGVLIPNDLKAILTKLPPKPKYDKEMSKILKDIIDADPLPNKQNTQWIIKLFTNNLLPLEDLYKATQYLSLYEKVKPRLPVEQRDINKFSSLPELYNIVSKFEKVEIKSKSEEEKEKKLEGANRIFDDAHWLVISPKTEAAACLYGQETQWCTASKGNNYFQRYNKDGPLYILFDKTIKEDPRKNPNKKLQFHFESGQFMDAQDHQIKIGDFFRKNRQLLSLFDSLGKTTPKFKLEHRLMEKNEVMKYLTNPKERVTFLEGDSDKFGADWIFNYLSELGETEEIKKIIFDDKLFLSKLLEKGQLDKLEVGFSKLKGVNKDMLADFLYNNPIVLNYFSKNPKKPKEIEDYIKILIRSGKKGEEYAKDMYIKTDTMYNIFKNNKDLVGFYDILQGKAFGNEGSSVGLEMLSAKNSKYVKDYLELFPLKSLNIIRGFLKDARKDFLSSKQKNESLAEVLSVEEFKKQFIKEGSDYLKNIGFPSR